ncbi:MAG: hypothetical protein KA408_01420 [Flavobacteriales bacterium]|nr:hypothetical protein [Flavobacteriales bacterium]
MTLKQTVLSLAFGLITVHVSGQALMDYFLPDSTKNKASFYTPDKNGLRSSITRTIYYINKGGEYEIIDSQSLKGQPSAIQTTTVKFVDNEVRMIKAVSTTMLEKNKKSDFNPHRVIFKMPPSGKTVSWTFVNVSGDNITCTASWTTVSIDGSPQPAIQVVKQYEGFSSKIIEYYVKGFGLWKTDMEEAAGRAQPSEIFDGLSYEADR